jgi:phosphatidylglycerophosphatase A
VTSTPSRSPLAWTAGSVFGIGLLGKGGGTVAAIVTCGLWWGAAQMLSPRDLAVATIVGAIVATVIGIGAANVMIRETGKQDPSEVVMDEVAGQLFALIAAPSPANWKYVLASLILFRALDIFKPPPVSTLEKLHGGAGVMLDDVAAGLIALGILQLLLRLHIGL